MIEKLKEELIKNNIEFSIEKEDLEKYSEDKSLFKIKPKIVVFPKNSAEIKILVKLANELNFSLTCYSGGTDMSGGPLTEDVLLVFTKYFNHWEINPDEKIAIVEPGVYFRDLEKELNKYNLMLPSYPASKEICTVGGMVANNSGGEKSLKYGKTKDYVIGLNVVLSNGEEYYFEKIEKENLEKEINQQNFKGEIFRRIYNLLNEKKELIEQSKPKVRKNSAGYNIWEVINSGFDLTKIFVGSQGTLGIITKIKFKLVEKEKFERLIVIFIYDLKKIPEFLNKVLPLEPSSLEITDEHTFKIYLKFAKEMASILGAKGIFQTFNLFLPEIKLILFSGIPKLIVLTEFEGNDQQELEQKILKTKKISEELGFKTAMPRNEIESQKYWKLRRDTYKLLREKIKNKIAGPFIDDIIVNPEYFPEFLPQLIEILEKYKFLYTISGHLGEGNLHIIPLLDLKKEREKIFPAMEEVYDLVLKYNGSITAEHNDGLIRGWYLKKMFGEDVFNIFLEIKNIFDPKNIFNPHKKVNNELEYSKKFLL